MRRVVLTALLIVVGFGSGCSNGGWCGYGQPAYPIGSYPYSGYPGAAPTYPNYPAPGAIGSTTTANSVAVPPTGAPMVAPGYPQYSQPLPGSYSAPAGYPGAYPPYAGGVPLNQFNPNAPLIGR
jgi:hypothetical protein